MLPAEACALSLFLSARTCALALPSVSNVLTALLSLLLYLPAGMAFVLPSCSPSDVAALEKVLPPTHYLMHAVYNAVMDIAINNQRFQEVCALHVCLCACVL